MKNTRISKRLHVLCFFAFILTMLPICSFADEGICARVKIEIRQEMTLERQAFDAHMRINNGFDTVILENVGVDVLFLDENKNGVIASSDPDSKDALFFIRLDSMENIDSVDGAGTVLPASSADIHWLIIPAPGASNGLESGTLYYVGATLTYAINGEEYTTEVSPDYIFVKPMPGLTLDYFLPTDVYGDDAFTAEIEPIVPFPLGVRVTNNGSGVAGKLKIESAQPKIVDNEQGLLISFLIEGSVVNGQPASPSLIVDFGDIEPNTCGTAHWIMTCSLSGEFVEFEADYSHADELGGELTSLLESVHTHFLVKDVRVDLPGRDDINDFLAQHDHGYKVYESDNVDTEVSNQSDSSRLTKEAAYRYTLATSPNQGFVYVQLTDPYAGKMRIRDIIRSDGKAVKPENAWLSKTRDANNNWKYFANLFDVNTPGTYTLTFEDLSAGPQPPVLHFIPDRSRAEGQQLGFIVEASDPNGTTPMLSTSPLPAGVKFTDKGDGTATFDWTPAAGQKGKYDVTFTASDGNLTASQVAAIIICSGKDDDADGMPDEWEIQNFGTLERNGKDDLDGDGISDISEYTNSTDPVKAVYNLTIRTEPSGVGTTTPAPGIHPHGKGTVVDIQAQAGFGYRFDQWTGDVGNPNSPSATVTMNSAKTVTANFVPIPVITGDVDYNGIVGMDDAILSLQIVGGIIPDIILNKMADVSKDGKIGMEEAICALQWSGGLKTESIEVSGMIIKDTIWNAGTVKVTSNIRIADGATLTIIPGTYVEFQGYYKLTVWGRLTAEGTADRIITFTAKDKSKGWGGIRFDNEYGEMDDNEFSKLLYCRLLYGKATEGTNIYDDTGGAIFMNDFSNILISDCIISNNQASGEGGGICCRYSNPVIINTVICNNTASGSGGGIYCGYSSPKLINNTIVHNNSASAGGGICLLGDSNPQITNTILWGNTAGSVKNQAALLQKNCNPYFSYCNIQGGLAAFSGWGAGRNYDESLYQNNIEADPLFVNPSDGVGIDSDGLSGNWTLQVSSPCIDRGTPDVTGLPELPETDLASNPRIHSDIIDIGAYEYQLSKP